MYHLWKETTGRGLFENTPILGKRVFHKIQFAKHKNAFATTSLIIVAVEMLCYCIVAILDIKQQPIE
jgi:hypothetical protein